MIGTDLIIALGLVGIVVVTFLISKIGILPKKTLPFVAAGLAAVFGITLLRERRIKSLRKDLADREQKLREEEKRLKTLKDKYGASELELNKAQAELERQRRAYERSILEINAKNDEEKKQIDALPDDEVFKKFREEFGQNS
jgi:septal ring factor EnvC (AmiA/AmiB activator)